MNQLVHPVEKPFKGITKIKGQFTMSFTVCCGVCEAHESFSANNINHAMTFAQTCGWRMSGNFGWTHRSCCKPTTSAFNLHFK